MEDRGETRHSGSGTLFYRGKPVSVERVEVPLSMIGGGAREVMVSVFIKAKIMGLTHGEGGFVLEFEIGENKYKMDDAVLFDLDHTQEGWTHLQLMGELRRV